MSEFQQRRESLLSKIPEGSLVLVPSGISKVTSEDENYPFEINRDFYYLTGIEQENSMLFMVKGIGESNQYLFIDEYDPVKERWTGRRLTTNEASKISSIENVLTNNMLESKIDLAIQQGSHYFGKIDRVFVDMGVEIKVEEDLFINDYASRLEFLYPHLEIFDCKPMITQQRMKKSNEEISFLSEAINLTQHGINQILLNLKPNRYEFNMADIFEFYGREKRAPLSFPTISAAGKNATCMHYPIQKDLIKENDLILFDLGYKYNHYCADISRTFPVSGKFNDLQKKIYSIVLLCNKAVIEYIKPGLKMSDLQKFASDFLTNECTRAGLLKKDENINKYYCHSVSHHLGLDCHDPADYTKPIEPGNVITVEPGLYFEEYGIGVRIEDDVLVTKNGSEVLSRSIPKEINDIERLMEQVRIYHE